MTPFNLGKRKEMAMRKAERLNDMMLFLNDKNLFQLSDIIAKYGVSRSTAIRDIQSLEEIGMPIYSERGRNGHYQVLRNRLLSPFFLISMRYLRSIFRCLP